LKEQQPEQAPAQWIQKQQRGRENVACSRVFGDGNCWIGQLDQQRLNAENPRLVLKTLE
tara:strand:+ start:90 stop:266 length:177 start_codon:yes stop_codon:yes gene_type:complete